MEVRTLPGRLVALGAAAHFVSRHEPFASFPSSSLIRTLSSQVDRGHYRFAIEGQRVVGYIGWALYDEADAQAFERTGQSPPDERALGADVVWILTAAVSGAEALLPMYKALRALYPGRRLMGIRHKGGGRRMIFDRMLQKASDAGPSNDH